jgi:hypothetical protein
MRLLEMEVKDVFAFEDGTVVFTGPIETHANFIGACKCEIVQDGEVKASLQIDGEMIPSTPLEKRTSHRAISTREVINLDAIGVARTGFTIRSEI